MTPDLAGSPRPISDRDLVSRFENLGDNCELGFAQRLAGAEPLGLLRFSSTPLRHILAALHGRLEGLADPDNVELTVSRGEYMVSLTKYGFFYHTHQREGETDPGALYRQQLAVLPFLRNKFLRDLEEGDKILVFRQNEPLAAAGLLELRSALNLYGNAPLLWVQDERPGRPAGTVAYVAPNLAMGFVRRLAPRELVPSLDLPSWLTMMRAACAMRPATATSGATAPPPPRRIDLVFGDNGNARAYTVSGWSPSEADGTWAVDTSSHLRLPMPAPATQYRLNIDAIPFVCPPALPGQRAAIAVNDETVRTFESFPAGRVTTFIPGHLIQGRDAVDIVIAHPDATPPSEVAGQNDTRRLSLLFRHLSLSALPEPAGTEDRPDTIELDFGLNGNAEDWQGDGWSVPEDGGTWSSGAQGSLILPLPKDTDTYRLEITLAPFLAPPALTAQRLGVATGGHAIHAFDVVEPCVVACEVPGQLLRGLAYAELIFSYPDAARPMDLGPSGDDRRLAVLFRRLTLSRVA